MGIENSYIFHKIEKQPKLNCVSVSVFIQNHPNFNTANIKSFTVISTKLPLPLKRQSRLQQTTNFATSFLILKKK